MRMHSKTYKKRFWIRYVIRECPVCGSGSEHRERVYDERKPNNPIDRYDINMMAYDNCMQ